MTAHRSLRNHRRRLALAPAAIALALLSACDRSDMSEPINASPSASNAAEAEPAPAPPLPQPVPPLDRAQLIDAAARAADAAASGNPLPEPNKQLVGRSFEVRLPFGCSGSTSRSDDWAAANFDAERKVLRLNVKPWTGESATWLTELAAGQPFDAVEGFWIERPWTTFEACPPRTAEPAGEVAKPRQTLAFAQFFAPDAPRTLQRGRRPYTVTRKLDADEQPAEGYRLVLEGRIAAFPDGQPVRCRVEDAALPPVCVTSVAFTRVAFERAPDGVVLAEWPR